MPNPAVRPEVHETLDAHLTRPAQVTFHREPSDLGTNLLKIGIRQIGHLGSRVHPALRTNRVRGGTADTVDVGQRDPHVLVIRNVDPSYAGHSVHPVPSQVINGGADAPKKAQKDTARTTKNQAITIRTTLEPGDQPCRCLWRGSLQITRTLPFLRITLQLRHIFLTDARTFTLPTPQKTGGYRTPDPP